MSKTLSQVPTVIDVATIVQHGEQLILPEGMDLAGAADLIQRRMKYEEEGTVISAKFDVLPFDGANALSEVLRAKYGWAQAVPIPSFWGPQPPQMISVEVAPNVFKEVPWGRFSLPNLDRKSFVETGVEMKDSRFIFSIQASIKRKDEVAVRSLFDDVRAFLKTGSIYMGQAIKLRFMDDNGNPLPMPLPVFIDTSRIDPDSLIYSADVMASVQTNLFTPVSRVRDCLANGIPVKRGILLGGTYGTGKTLAATVAARLATDAGVTYVYIPRADELAHAIEFGKQYQSPACVIFCEDVDRVTSGERDVKMDDLLNILDGIDTKNANIITVLTTNDLNSINAAMLRPGRLDAVIDVTPPDGPAVEKLLRLYAGSTVSASTDLTEVGKILEGNIPAVIAEVVKRAKLSQLRFQDAGEPVSEIGEPALIDAAKTMQAQVTLLRNRSAKPTPALTVDEALGTQLSVALEPLVQTVAKIAKEVGIPA